MNIREWKRPVAVTLLVVGLILLGSGLYLWLSPHGPGLGTGYGPGHGPWHGSGRGGSGVYTFRYFMKDVHLYLGLFFAVVVGVHLACNWKTMLRHLGVLKDEPRNAASRTPKSPNMPPQQ